MFKVIELLNGTFGILYKDCLAPEPFAPNDTIMHMALAKILNLWSESDSVRPVSRAHVGTPTGTVMDTLKVRPVVQL